MPVASLRSDNLPTFVDHSALSFDTIFVSAGRRGREMELAPCDLISLTSAQVRKLGRGLRCVAVVSEMGHRGDARTPRGRRRG